MPLTPVPGRSMQDLLSAVHVQRLALMMVESSAASPKWQGLLPSSYLEWVRTSHREFRAVMGATAADRLLTTWRYERVLAMPDGSRERAELVREEVASLKEVLTAAAAGVVKLVERRRTHGGVLVVPDTNFLVQSSRTLLHTDWWKAAPSVGADGVHVVLLSVVIDELENLKRAQRNNRAANGTPVRTRAGTVLDEVEEVFRVAPTEVLQLRPRPPWEGHRALGPVMVELVQDDPDHERLPSGDAEIVEQCRVLKSSADREVYLLTYDVGLRLRARTAGVSVVKVEQPTAGS